MVIRAEHDIPPRGVKPLGRETQKPRRLTELVKGNVNVPQAPDIRERRGSLDVEK
jgi:hypothetical protein